MNKKKDPDLVRNIHYLVRLNKPEDQLFQEQLKKSNGMKQTDFIREMITKGYVKAPKHLSERMDVRDLIRLLIEYKTNFRRITNLIRNSDPALTQEVDRTTNSIQQIMDRL